MNLSCISDGSTQQKNIGYAYDTSMTAELAVKAVENACLNVKSTEGIILHSNWGV
ncbi:hypothetical protein [Lacrimispora sp.]|uniref:hypothetical protein n=1 Tax=Lacrimispora sp. TaxID=2719234 RepID=UPI0028975FE5|nr:hypothetical protein [Lacrimispora sp.]